MCLIHGADREGSRGERRALSIMKPELPYELDDEATPTPGVGSGRDILVVDDNQTNLVAIEAALSPLGRKLVLAHSGMEALARLLEQDFALIILDVAMPGLDGFETARLVRSRERNRATPIIFVTGLSWQTTPCSAATSSARSTS